MASEDSDLKETLTKELDDLKQTRDELKVQLHLAAADAKSEWDKLEKKWERVEEELNRIGSHAKAPIDEIGKSAKSLITEIKQGYSRVRSSIKQ